jgi:F-type H+-transporting ATPase subunit b
VSVVNVALAQSGLGDYIFGLDPQLIFDSLITMLAMFCLFLLLSYLLFNPARDLFEKRQKLIRENMETAAKEKADAIEFKEQYDEKLKNVEAESEEILSETRRKALKKESDIVNEAKEEANRILERANREVELEKNKVKDEVKQEMITVAAAMAGKIVAASLDEGEQSQLVADTLKEMGDETWLS